jgi:hypothetical protein
MGGWVRAGMKESVEGERVRAGMKERYGWMGSCGDEGEGFVQEKKLKFAS